MIASCRRLSANRCLVVTLIASGLAVPLPSTAQRRDRAEDFAFLAFLQNIVAQRTARICERGMPDYRQRFDGLYARWSEKHRDTIARGEVVFRDAIKNRNRPDTENANLEQIEKAVSELAQSSGDTNPIELNDNQRAECENNLSDLEAGLGS